MKRLTGLVAGILLITLGFLVGARYSQFLSPTSLTSPFSSQEPEPEKPYLAYTIPILHEYPYQTSTIVLEDVLEEGDTFTGYQFSYTSLGKKISGRINIPATALSGTPSPVVLMNRGWAPRETYVTGTGTNPAARVFARNGYITIAPDFLGYGGSDPEPEDEWEARFIKPINVIELLETIRQEQSLVVSSESNLPSSLKQLRFDPNRIAFWGHSNGGQITISLLEILREPIPATIWAPVTAPFPYSLLFFTDEDRDEGKGFRKWLANFEQQYDVYEFTITRHVDKLTGPLQIQHGTADEAALIAWSDEFVDRLEVENDRREFLREQIAKAETASEAAALEAQAPSARLLENIEYTYLRYPGANHNMQPAWDEVVQKDLEFFAEHL